ncbi:hypothetical protein COU17_00770 [Candidatus Kaiserbacteria bacterium CG10_big_fil_rev_8_21_14_0_10_49_17]|uniref:DegT/DnrJ/EryC1/StrS family aminotransferase n=1 Tax=Candidatus Kaiserbacteria bacterium CG10_big_fil_rev_8_21_14_0_10_49_17 TaxID=1974609 RepID=A0A2M6WET3_9BACT|nr:MAG: hypothetical protein COU17_00770 [Candidatus Kaiserbacteria bacterium CG10_big_fil_rev_8_21_14_0_10_49_17]
MVYVFGRRGTAVRQHILTFYAACAVLSRGAEYGYEVTETRRFEQDFSAFLRAPVLGVGGGSDAIELSLKVLGVGRGDEVIVPAFGCMALVAPIVWLGATPIFIDVQSDDLSLDPHQLQRAITKHTRAILIAHLFGQPSREIERVVHIARAHKVPVIEDAAQALGASIDSSGSQRPVGTIGDFGCFSFSGTKLLSSPGAAGALFVRDPSQRDLAARLRKYGSSRLFYEYPHVGTNGKLDELHAAILHAKLPFLPFWLSYRRTLASCYTDRLRDIKEITLPTEAEGTVRSWYRYTVQAAERDALLTHLKREFTHIPRLQPVVHYPIPLPYFEAFGGHWDAGSFPVAENATESILSLPLFDSMSLRDVSRVAGAIRSFYGRRD